jgi:hypothetical protein
LGLWQDRASWWESVIEQKISPHDQEAKEIMGLDPTVLFKDTPSDLRASHWE